MAKAENSISRTIKMWNDVWPDKSQPLQPITLESPMNDSKTDFVANVAANGTIPPVISFAKQAISGRQESNSVAVC